MKLNLISTKEILDLEKEIGFDLIVTEQKPNYYTVEFEDSWSKDGSLLYGKLGGGNTIDSAIQDYCKKVSGLKMVCGAFTDHRKEFNFPKLIHTKHLSSC